MASASQISNSLRSFVEIYQDEMMRAETDNADDAMETILGYFSGPVSEAEQREMYDPYGPYSTAGPHPPAPAEFVNVQTGETRDQWEQDGPKWQDGHIVTVIENPSQVAQWLLTGTEKMIARPYIEAVEEDIAPRVEERRNQAQERAFAFLPKG